jgi:formylglycine-generating enzyme required for sulfatase activity
MHFKAVLIGVSAVVMSQATQATEMVSIGDFKIDRTEVSIRQMQAFAAATGFVSQAERTGGGSVYGLGWQQKAGWTWKTPFGQAADLDQPAVHLTFDEAQSYCQWRGARLPTDSEWMEAAYTERRLNPPPGFETGVTYPYPTGASPTGANCLNDCGRISSQIDYSRLLMRGIGPAPVGTTVAGVNGLFDMGANVWEWVDSGSVGEQVTRGGSWWYGARRMHRTDRATKPRDTAVVYIGFRCARDA